MKKYSNKLFVILIFASLLALNACNKTVKSPSAESQQVKLINLVLREADVYLTAQNTTNRLTKLPEVVFNTMPQPEESFPTIMLNPDKTFQTLEGFGGALTDASAETFYKLPENVRKEILTAYYDTDKGIGYTIGRTHINSCDFSSGIYAYDEVAGDTSLSKFSIDHDKKFRIPLIREALKMTHNNLKLFASPWSPPAWMKTNDDMLHGGSLKSIYYQTWANYYIKFLQDYHNEGIDFWGLTVQNEPMAVQKWESCIYTAEDEKNFVKKYLGPTLKKSEFNKIKLMIWDHNRGIIFQRAQVVYDDPEASQYVWGTAYHWYVGDHFDNLKQLNQAYPDKKLFFSEGCVGPFDPKGINDWSVGETYGRSIVNDLNSGTVGWTDWNILLDEMGGPNHVQNYCYAPVIGDTKTGKIQYMNSYYYIGHFSKFIRPGAKRIVCTSNDDNLQATAFLNTDGTIAVVILNLTDLGTDFKVWLRDRFIQTNSPAHSIITVVFK